MNGFWGELWEQAKHVIDKFALGATVASLVGWLPQVASALVCIWWAIRIYETRTVQRLLGRE